jgi:glucokinase
MVTQAGPEAQLRGGIDLGGTKIEAIVVDGGNQVLGSARHPTPSRGGPDDVVAEIVATMREACSAAAITPARLVGVGVGSPGAVDAATGTVSSARNLPGWEGSYALGPELERRLGARVSVGNDVVVATAGESELGAGRGRDSLRGGFWGTGVGGGRVLGGKPWHGRGGAGEIGHMVIRRGGRRCGCGNRGCVEAYAGRASMEARARRRIDGGRRSDLPKVMRERGRDHFTSSVWWHAVEKGDRLASELIDGAVAALGAGIASACNLLDIELVLIGGGLGVRFGEPYVKRIRKQMKPHLFPGHQPPEVRLVELGDLGGALGAALLARDARP